MLISAGIRSAVGKEICSIRGVYGRRISRNVYTKTREEWEEKLAAMIEAVKKENAVTKLIKKEGHPDLVNYQIGMQ